MSFSSLRSAGDAIDATRSFLIPPSLRRWSKLAVAVFFLGTAGLPLPVSPQLLDPRIWRPAPEAEGDAVPASPDGTADSTDSTAGVDGSETTGTGVVDGPTGDGALLEAIDPILPYLIAAVALVVLLVAGYTLLGIVMRFVLVESLRSENVRLRAYARRYLRGSASVFGVVAALVVLAVPPLALAVVVAAPFGPVQLSLTGAAIVAVLALAWTALLVTVHAATVQFVVPVMVECDCGVREGWRILWPTLFDEWKEYLLFGVVRTILDVAIGIASVLLLGAVAVALGVVAVTVGGIVVLLAGGPTTSTAAAVALGAVLVLFVIGLVVGFAYVNVPFQVYRWYYALLVLGDIAEDLDLISDRRASIRDEETDGVTA